MQYMRDLFLNPEPKDEAMPLTWKTGRIMVPLIEMGYGEGEPVVRVNNLFYISKIQNSRGLA